MEEVRSRLPSSARADRAGSVLQLRHGAMLMHSMRLETLGEEVTHAGMHERYERSCPS